MRSATSYFNSTLYRKTLARFWPLWVGYGVIWMFCIPLNMLTAYFDRYSSTAPQRRLTEMAAQLPAFVEPGLYLAGFFAILCAMAVFGYLYNHRSACWTHALPLRREALFTTQYLAGLSFLLLPQLVVAVLTAVIEVSFLPMSGWGAAMAALLAWLLAQSGICLFFFSFAAFCAMFTGHILALPAFYVILNILADVIYSLIEALMSEFFFGYNGSSSAYRIVEYLTPGIALRNAAYWQSERGFQSLATIAVYAGVGVLLAAASLYVYRRRHVETAGDVVAVAIVRPVFKYGVSFCSGLCFGMFTAAFFGWNDMPALIACILVWAVVGCFVAEMLLRKSFRVLKAWKGAAAMAAVLLVLCLVCFLDLFNVAGRVPALSQVESVQVFAYMGYPNDSGHHLDATIQDPAQIEKFLALHQAIVDHRDQVNTDGYTHTHDSRFDLDYASLHLTYRLSGGGELSRRYYSIPLSGADLNTPGAITCAFKQLLEDRTLVAQTYGFDEFLENGRLTGAHLARVLQDGKLYSEDVYLDDYRQELWDAVQKDFAEGTIGVRYPFDGSAERRRNTYLTDLTFEGLKSYTEAVGPAGEPGNYSMTASSNHYLTITLTPQAKHTLAVLEQAGVFAEGYALAPWEEPLNDKYPDTFSDGVEAEIVY
jgi:ABC-2 type transport system permease protein